MRYNRDGFSIEAGLEKGREPPEWFYDEPVLLSTDAFLVQAFFELSTCRSYSQGAFGPIPWDAIVGFSDRFGMDRDASDYFLKLIRYLDRFWMKWQSDEMKKRASAAR